MLSFLSRLFIIKDLTGFSLGGGGASLRSYGLGILLSGY